MLLGLKTVTDGLMISRASGLGETSITVELTADIDIPMVERRCRGTPLAVNRASWAHSGSGSAARLTRPDVRREGPRSL